MADIVAVYASPRRRGNSAVLLSEAVAGARQAGAVVHEAVLRDLKISPCLEIYGCKKTGRCVIDDDFGPLLDQIMAARGLILASPIFFYALSAQAKIFIDRFQSRWVKKYWIDRTPFGGGAISRECLFIGVGATKGKKLFDGALATMKYFVDTLDMELAESLLYRGLDFEGDAAAHPEYLAECRQAGARFWEGLRDTHRPS